MRSSVRDQEGTEAEEVVKLTFCLLVGPPLFVPVFGFWSPALTAGSASKNVIFALVIGG